MILLFDSNGDKKGLRPYTHIHIYNRIHMGVALNYLFDFATYLLLPAQHTAAGINREEKLN